jgi:hypothetical protein
MTADPTRDNEGSTKRTGPLPTDREKRTHDVALAARAAEIELFWKRSLFFWGFITTAFVGYVSTYKSQHLVAPIFACFGLVCSVAWSLANRGSKYWQENWETKVERAERAITGPLFSIQEPSQDKGYFSGTRFSVSGLAIAVSDYVSASWLLLALQHALSPLYAASTIGPMRPLLPALLLIATLLYCFAVQRSLRRPVTDTLDAQVQSGSSPQL